MGCVKRHVEPCRLFSLLYAWGRLEIDQPKVHVRRGSMESERYTEAHLNVL